MNNIDILNQYRFYTEADLTAKKEFESHCQFVQLKEGDYVFSEGDTCHQIALIGQGRVRVFKTNISGREITLYNVQPEETCILTSICLFTQKVYPATARAEIDTEAVLFPASNFRQWFNQYESVRQLIFQTMAKRTTQMMLLLEEITFRKMDQRLAGYLLQKFTGGDLPLIEIQSTHEDIATELITAREVVSRLLKDLERSGAIQLARGRIRLVDESLLRKSAASE